MTWIWVHKRWWWALLAFVLVAVVAAIFGFSNTPTRQTAASTSGPTTTPVPNDFTSPAAVASALQAAGLGCVDFSQTAPPDTELSVDQEGSCTADGESDTLYTFRDAGQRDNWLGMVGRLGCSFGKALGMSTFNLVIGPHWAISTSSATSAAAISTGIGGTTRTVDCW